MDHLGFKARPVLDVLNQAGYLLVFVLATMHFVWRLGIFQLS